MRILLTACITIAAAAFGPPSALGHGGAGFRDPPPDSRQPADPPPPPDEPPPEESRRRGLDEWTHWWEHNARRLTADRPQRRMPRGFMADSRIHREIAPALRALLDADAKDVDGDIHSAAALALARMRDTECVPRLLEMSANASGAFQSIVAESATLALGLLGRDTAAIREHLLLLAAGGAPEMRFRRPFAIVALGLLGHGGDLDGAAVEVFLGLVDDAACSADVRCAGILALGLLGGERPADALLAMAQTRKSPRGVRDLSDSERSHAIASLGRIGCAGFPRPGEETAIADWLLDLVGRRGDGDAANVRRSAVMSLGRIGARSIDPEAADRILGTLELTAAGAVDVQERSFALLAIGGIGAARVGDEELRERCVDALAKTLADGVDPTPPFAALGLGLVGRAMGAAGAVPDEARMCRPVRDLFQRTGDPRRRAAYAIASGLMQDGRAELSLRAVLRDVCGDAKLRGAAAVALGMMDALGAREEVRDVLLHETDKDLRVSAAAAADLLGGDVVVPELLCVLQDANESQYVLGGTALALGRLRDERAVQPLLRIAANTRDYPNITRALAVVALGQIGDPRDVPAIADLAADLNYRDRTPFEVELLTIL